jgi:putative colanic acid biosynthesis acetyltransferase WcaF
MLLWDACWALFCAWTPKPLNRWRLFWLRIFGAKLEGTPFVHQRARIQIPWNLTLHDRSCLGDRANAYTLGEIEIGPRTVIAQEAYLCTGTHDLNDPNWPLQVAKISIGADVFVGARAFIMPGITIGERAVVGACSVVTKDVEPRTVVVGNPAKPQKRDSTR